jgi:hypothetical protein
VRIVWTLVLTPVIPTSQEAEIRRIVVQSQTRKISLGDPISKILKTNRAGGVALSSSLGTAK